MGTLCTIGTGPPVSMASSRLLLELLESLTESSESLLLEELELELARWRGPAARIPPAASAAVNPFPVGRGAEDTGGSVLDGCLGGTGIEAKIAAVDVNEPIGGCLVGGACCCLLRPLREAELRGSDTISGLLAVDCGFCLARATAFVIFASAMADTFVAGLVVFFTPPDFTADVFELVLVADEWSSVVVVLVVTPGLVS